MVVDPNGHHGQPGGGHPPLHPQQQPGLEVAPTEYQGDGSEKAAPQVYYDVGIEVLQPEQKALPPQAAFMHNYYQTNYDPSNPSASVFTASPNQAFTAVPGTVSGASAAVSSWGGDQHPPPQEVAGDAVISNKFFVMRRKTMVIIAIVVAVLLVGAVAGGVAGGLLGARNRGSGESQSNSEDGGNGGAAPGTGGNGGKPNDTVVTGPNSAFYASTSLASLSYTVGSRDYQMVVFQPNSSDTELAFAQWNSSARVWETNHIQPRVSGGATIEAQPGTPITAAVRPGNDFAIVVFYLSVSNVIQELRTHDARGLKWVKTTSSVTVAAASQLAARWDDCRNKFCSGALMCAYEDDSHRQKWHYSVKADNSSRTTSAALLLVPGSGLAVTGISVNATTDMDGAGIRLYFHTSEKQAAGNLQEWSRKSDYNWLITNTGLVKKLPVDEPPLIHASAFANPDVSGSSPEYVMIVNRFRNGTIQTLNWNGNNWRRPQEPFIRNAESANLTTFTAISVSPDPKVFGLTGDGKLHSFTPDLNDPVSWTYDGEIVVSS